MNRRLVSVTLVLMLCMAMVCGCGKKDAETTYETFNGEAVESVEESTNSPEVKPSVSSDDNATSAAETTAGTTAAATTAGETTAQVSTQSASTIVLSDEVARDAIQNFCVSENPDLVNYMGDDNYTMYWEVVSSNDGQVVVLFRSYTGAEVRYYIARPSGETYVTEFVPGITDEEQKTGQTFNARDYIALEIYG